MTDLDAVIVENKETEQAAAALKFARAGFALHVDKPCGGAMQDFDELIRVVKEKRLPFQVGYMYRYNPAVQRALELVRSGRLGDITAVELQMSQCYHGDMLRFLGDLPGGMMFYLGCHLVDLMLLAQGEPLEVLPFNTASGTEEAGIQDVGFALLRYPHGLPLSRPQPARSAATRGGRWVIAGTRGNRGNQAAGKSGGGSRHAVRQSD